MKTLPGVIVRRVPTKLGRKGLADKARPTRLTDQAAGVLYECMHTQAQTLAALRIGDTGVPIYVQLREQFLRAMGARLMTPGDQMHSAVGRPGFASHCR